MSLRRDTERYLRALDDAGYTLRRTKRSHWLILDDTTVVAGAANSPSDHRGLRNLKSRVRRWERSKENAA